MNYPLPQILTLKELPFKAQFIFIPEYKNAQFIIKSNQGVKHYLSGIDSFNNVNSERGFKSRFFKNIPTTLFWCICAIIFGAGLLYLFKKNRRR